jgi:hypothetical protein
MDMATNRNDGPGYDVSKAAADALLAEANDGLDGVRAAKRRASQQTTKDVHDGVLARARRERWNTTS